MSVSVIQSKEPQSTAITLRDAIANDFESVIVFGFKDGKITIQSSDIEDNIRLIGALEAAKQNVWNNC